MKSQLTRNTTIRVFCLGLLLLAVKGSMDLSNLEMEDSDHRVKTAKLSAKYFIDSSEPISFSNLKEFYYESNNFRSKLTATEINNLNKKSRSLLNNLNLYLQKIYKPYYDYAEVIEMIDSHSFSQFLNKKYKSVLRQVKKEISVEVTEQLNTDL